MYPIAMQDSNDPILTIEIEVLKILLQTNSFPFSALPLRRARVWWPCIEGSVLPVMLVSAWSLWELRGVSIEPRSSGVPKHPKYVQQRKMRGLFSR